MSWSASIRRQRSSFLHRSLAPDSSPRSDSTLALSRGDGVGQDEERFGSIVRHRSEDRVQVVGTLYRR